MYIVFCLLVKYNIYIYVKRRIKNDKKINYNCTPSGGVQNTKPNIAFRFTLN